MWQLFVCLLILGNSLGNISKGFDIILCIILSKKSGDNSSRKNATAPTKGNIFFSLELKTVLL